MKKLEDIFGIEINNTDLFQKALTHPSYTKENDLVYTENYERLEFLGDAVLKLAVSEILYREFPDYNEGNLSKIRSIVVSDSILSDAAHKIGLCEHIILAKHEAKLGLANLESVCACAFEAVLGAYYLDGKLKLLIPELKKILMPYVKEVDLNFGKYNAKAILQEYTQSLTKTAPVYKLTNESGPAHNRTFEIEVFFDDKFLSKGTGKTKKEAEQQAAYEACKLLGVI